MSSTKNKVTIVSESAPLQQYKWGGDCDAFVLVDNNQLSVKLEQMPANSQEVRHYHNTAQQFFYVLGGEATIDIEGEKVILKRSEGLLIEPGTKHCILNLQSEVLKFVVTSQPNTQHDRINTTLN